MLRQRLNSFYLTPVNHSCEIRSSVLDYFRMIWPRCLWSRGFPFRVVMRGFFTMDFDLQPEIHTFFTATTNQYDPS